MYSRNDIYNKVLRANVAILDNEVFKHRYENHSVSVDISNLSERSVEVVYWDEDTRVLILRSKPVLDMKKIEFERRKFIRTWSRSIQNLLYGCVNLDPVQEAGLDCAISNIIDEAIEKRDKLELP